MESSAGKRKIITAVILVISLIVTGTLGYMLIEGDDFLNSLYMTIITVSTVGFGEIHKFSAPGKIFTIFIIILSISIYAYSITIITNYFLEGQLAVLIKGYRAIKQRNMENHVIICGYGRNGQQACLELDSHGQPYLVIDQNHDLVLKHMGKEAQFIEGDATLDETLKKAHVEKARALITTLPIDADNLYVVLTARSLNPSLKIISRASDESSEKKLKIAGANSVVMPEKVGGTHMAILVARPDVLEFVEHLSIHGEDPTKLVEITCMNLSPEVADKTFHEIGIRSKTGVNIIGFKSPEGSYLLNPSPGTPVSKGSKLFVLGTSEEIRKVKALLRSDGDDVKS
jgi:voltage-gated potassium channel